MNTVNLEANENIVFLKKAKNQTNDIKKKAKSLLSNVV